MTQSWIRIDLLEQLIHWEAFFLLNALSVFAYGFYRFFLTDVSLERHKSLKLKFRSLLKSYLVLCILFFIFEVFLQLRDIYFIVRMYSYLGLAIITVGGILFVQLCRLYILMYLFLTSMRAGVPILLVNIFTLILSLVLAAWTLTSIFGIQVGPLLATSAAFSIILGLALQDTLGNLFAGISLQLDNVFEIGNWIEIFINGQKVTGQVHEISWRSVILIGTTEEIITIPNRTAAQSQISNWSKPDTAFIRSQSFRIAYGEDIETIKTILVSAARETHHLKKNPAPFVIVSEMNDSWVIVKLIYYIDNFGSQFLIGDEVINTCLNALQQNKVSIATPIIRVKTVGDN